MTARTFVELTLFIFGAFWLLEFVGRQVAPAWVSWVRERRRQRVLKAELQERLRREYRLEDVELLRIRLRELRDRKGVRGA